MLLVPLPVGALALGQKADALADRVAVDLARCHQPEQRPGGLRRRADLASAARRVRLIGIAVLAPAAIFALFRDQPGDGAAHVRPLHVDAGGVVGAQHRPGAVDVIRAPAAEPGTVRLLLTAPKIDAGDDRRASLAI